MPTKKNLILILCISLISFNIDEPFLNESDLQILSGDKWTGTLTYQDYESNNNISIPVELTVFLSDEFKNIFVFNYEYPDEPHANSSDTAMISDDGKYFDNEKVLSKSVLPDSTFEFVTEKDGEDNDRSAEFRYTYKLSDKIFSVVKEVKYSDEENYFKRNEFKFMR